MHMNLGRSAAEQPRDQIVASAEVELLRDDAEGILGSDEIDGEDPGIGLEHPQ